MALALRFAEEGEYRSRACDLSYDDEQDAAPAAALFRWSRHARAHAPSGVVAVKRLVVATSGSAQLFLERLTASWPIVATLVATDQAIPAVTLDASRPAACQIRSLHPADHASFGSDVAVIVPRDLSSSAIWHWVAALQQHLPADETVVLDSQLSTIYDFGGYGTDDAPLLRMLASSAARDAKFERLIPTLETPRFVAGLAAALLTQGELRKRRVRVFVSLRSANSLPSESARSFAPLVSLLDLPIAAIGDAATPAKPIEEEFNALYT